MRPTRSLAVLLLPLALAACAESMLAPTPGTDPVTVAAAAAARSTPDTYIPLLTRLIDNTVAELRKQGKTTEASRIVNRQRTLAQDAERALAGGDQAGHDAARETAELEGSVAVMRVLGQPILRRVLASVAADLPTFNRRIAAARGTARSLDWMTPVVTRATRLKAAADGAASSDPALALRYSALAFDLLAVLPR